MRQSRFYLFLATMALAAAAAGSASAASASALPPCPSKRCAGDGTPWTGVCYYQINKYCENVGGLCRTGQCPF